MIDLLSRQSWQKYDIPKSFEWKGRKRCRFRPSWLYIVPEIIINNDTAVHSGRKWLVKYGTTTISTQRPLWPIFRTLNSKVVCNCFRNATLIFHILIHSGWRLPIIENIYLFFIKNQDFWPKSDFQSDFFCQESSKYLQFPIFSNLSVILFSQHNDLPRYVDFLAKILNI